MTDSSSAFRVVDRFVDHGAPLSFRELCTHVLDEKTEYLILDLDKTTHLGRNLGELLAWELCAHEVYGDSGTKHRARRWFGGRMLLDWSQPRRVLQYVVAGARRWALAGFHYLVWGKMASHVPWLRRLAFRRFGPEPTTVVQRRPQKVALAHLATADESLLQVLARRIWKRHSADQVISREDLDWVRTHCPGIEIVLSSASPKAMLDVAVEELGADRAYYSTAERINSGNAKIAHLREICPRMFEADAKAVAITDTGYGEDHCWAEHFSCVVDINSPTPFSPVVTSASPLKEIHSAIVLTGEEQRRRREGLKAYLDARRPSSIPRERVELDRTSLGALLQDQLVEINLLAARVASVPPGADMAYAQTTLTESCRTLLGPA